MTPGSIRRLRRPALAILTALACALPAVPASAHEGGGGVGHAVLMYLPNRIFDVLDVVRARVRLGPGMAFSGRLTEPLSALMGGYQTIWIGLPGPRGKAVLPIPGGQESYAGVQLSVSGEPTDAPGPGYGPAEVGVGVHALVAGADVGVELLEILDLVTGLFFIDLRGDDL